MRSTGAPRSTREGFRLNATPAEPLRNLNRDGMMSFLFALDIAELITDKFFDFLFLQAMRGTP